MWEQHEDLEDFLDHSVQTESSEEPMTPEATLDFNNDSEEEKEPTLQTKSPARKLLKVSRRLDGQPKRMKLEDCAKM